MYITHMRIQNYRNLQDVDMTFHEKANYIVGENAIGKSGLLRLLAYMSDGRNVDEDDYADPSQPSSSPWDFISSRATGVLCGQTR